MKNILHYRTRIAAISAPALIFLYGSLRFIDVSEDNHDHGFNWNVGHVFFLIAFLLFGVLVVDLSRLIAATKKPKLMPSLSMTAGLFGVLCFVWGIVCDLFPYLQNKAPVPQLLKIAGPLLFQLGLLSLLLMLAATGERKIPAWSPVLVLIGFVVFAVSLDLVPIGSLILLIGLSPLSRFCNSGQLQNKNSS